MNETELLFSEILNCDRVDLYLNKNKSLGSGKASFAARVLKRRMVGEPIDYILGFTEFMGLKFKVTKGVLIPRPETEILVELTLRYAVDYKVPQILEIGTGSGCIAVSLAKFVPNSEITATDISSVALDVARLNAKSNKLNGRVKFVKSDLFKCRELQDNKYDIIISNPPYVSGSCIADLQPEVQFEPSIALDGGIDGLDFYRKIINQAPRYLAKNGLLIIEIGFDQAENIKNIFQKSGNFEIIEVMRDYSNIDRVIIAKKA